MGVGCEAPHLRSIYPNFPDGFCTLLIFYASSSTVFQGGLVSLYPLSPLFVKEALFLRERGIIARLLRPHLSGAFGAINSTYTL